MKTMTMTMTMMTNITSTTVYFPGYSPEFIFLYSFFSFNLIALLSLNLKINSLMVYDEYTDHKRDFDIFVPLGEGIPEQLQRLSEIFYHHSTILVNNNFINQLSSMEANKLISCFKELNTKLDLVSYTIEKVLYIPPPEEMSNWYDWEPIYRNSYVLLRQSINIIEELVNSLVSIGNFDPTILGM